MDVLSSATHVSLDRPVHQHHLASNLFSDSQEPHYDDIQWKKALCRFRIIDDLEISLDERNLAEAIVLVPWRIWLVAILVDPELVLRLELVNR